MERTGRVVIVDPAYASDVGHHGDVNTRLLAALGGRDWSVQCWADAAVPAAGCRGVFRDCGYVDPRHWADLGGTVHLARRMESQLHRALAEQGPVGGWVMHTALPFQLLGLARALCHCPAADVVVSLMFAPGETLEGPGGEADATSNCRVALGALARAVERGGHRLRLLLPSQQSLELYAPLLAAAGLTCTTAVHICYGYGIKANIDWKGTLGEEWRQYEKIFPAIAKSSIKQVSLECYHSHVPPHLMKLLQGKDVLVGVIDVASDEVETPEQVADTIGLALQYVPKERLFACTNCGMAPMKREIAVRKLAAIAKGAALARQRYG